MDVEDVKEWVVWVKPEAFYAQPMVFKEDSKKWIGGVGWKKILLTYGKRLRKPLREGVECVSELGLHLLDSFLLIYRPLDERESTDIAKISRKWSKPDKHGHGNGIECAKAGRMLSKSYTSSKAPIGQFPKGMTRVQERKYTKI
ncbi:hypothetical protein Tco_0934923 [Tanacetum coccineum]